MVNSVKRDSKGRFIKGTAKCKGGMGRSDRHASEAVGKIRAANRGKPKSAEHRRKISEALKGKKKNYATPGFTGKRHTAVTKQRISADAKRRAMASGSTTFKKGNVTWSTGKVMDAEYRKNMSEAIKEKWQDPEYAAKQIEAFRRVHRESMYKSGYHLSPKTNDKHYYRSSYELQAYLLLDADPNVALYITEPMAISYTYKGTARRYIPDIYVEMADGSWIIIEVKPEHQLDQPDIQAKLDAALTELPEGCFTVWCEAELFGGELLC